MYAGICECNNWVWHTWWLIVFNQLLFPLYLRRCNRAGQPQFNVTLLNWSNFFASMIEPAKHRDLWRSYKACDIFIGGVDFTISYMYASLNFHQLLYTESLLSNEHYGLTHANYDTYVNSEYVLRHITTVWPHPTELRLYGDKVSLIANFDAIAHNVTKTRRPVTIALNPNDPIPPDVVVKRGFSETGNHVLMPGDIKQRWSYLNRHLILPRACWFYQPFIHHLADMGEFRVFFVNAQPVYTVWTHKNLAENGEWEFDLVEDYYSLAELR